MNSCYGCRYSYDDVSEGWNCTRFDAVIKFSDGSTMNWPGQSCVVAYKNDCHGNGFKRSIVPSIIRKYPLAFIPVWATLLTIIIMGLIK